METDTIKIHFFRCGGNRYRLQISSGYRGQKNTCGLWSISGAQRTTPEKLGISTCQHQRNWCGIAYPWSFGPYRYLPRLVKQGFRGPIYGTYPTLDIAKIILNDSAKIQEQEAERANKEGYSKHSPAEPLYDLKDVEKTIPYFKGIPPNQWLPLLKNVKARFQYNGHILGATYIELDVQDKRFVFSGDIG